MSFPTAPCQADYFVRQTFDDFGFFSFQDSHTVCPCESTDPKTVYRAGDAVLIKQPEGADGWRVLEPAILPQSPPRDRSASVRVRRLKRKCRNADGPGAWAEPNELILTDEDRMIKPGAISRRCLPAVRCFSKEEQVRGSIPPPYCRAGIGNAFFITSEEKQYGRTYPISDSSRQAINQGFTLLIKLRFLALKGLDLFCGAGNFGRGVEE